jgi:hypothetical protein
LSAGARRDSVSTGLVATDGIAMRGADRRTGKLGTSIYLAGLRIS